MSSPHKSVTQIPLSVPEIRGNEWNYVKECLDTGWVSSVGQFVERFERSVAEFVGSKFGVATCNGTSALHIALLVAGVEPDDEVLVSTLTFIAPVNAIRYAGAWPVLIDAEPEYWQIDPQRVHDFLTKRCCLRNGQLRNRLTGRRVKAILPVHILGHPANLQPILEVARKFDLPVIEDATECLGAKYQQRSVGTIGDIACFSFNGNKIITTGGGGAIVTDNASWGHRARYLTTQAKDDPVEFVHGALGYNYRLTNIQAAIGCGQMELLPEYLSKKQDIALRYTRGLEGVQGITVMPEAPWAKSIFWLYTILVDPEQFAMDSREVLRNLEHRGIQTRPLWQPMHQSPVHRASQIEGRETADWLYKRALSLPCSVGLSETDQDHVINSLLDLNR